MQTRRGSVVQRCVYAELECLGERRRLGGEERAKKGGDLPGESLDEREEGRGGDAGDVDEKLAAIAVEEEGVAERHGGPGGGLHAQREGAEGVLLGADPGAVDGRRAVEGGEPGLPVSEGKRGNVEAVGGEEEQRVGGEGRRGGRGGRGNGKGGGGGGGGGGGAGGGRGGAGGGGGGEWRAKRQRRSVQRGRRWRGRRSTRSAERSRSTSTICSTSSEAWRE